MFECLVQFVELFGKDYALVGWRRSVTGVGFEVSKDHAIPS